MSGTLYLEPDLHMELHFLPSLAFFVANTTQLMAFFLFVSIKGQLGKNHQLTAENQLNTNQAKIVHHYKAGLDFS